MVDGDIPRDRWGRPQIIPRNGGKPVAYTRCTTFVDALDDKTNLTLWKQRQTALGLSQRPDLLLEVQGLAGDPDDHKRDLDKVCEQAMQAVASSAKASIGTGLHALTERLDRGLDLGTVQEQFRPHLAAYQEATQSLTPLFLEQFVVQDDLQVAGTADRIVQVAGEQGCFVADIKTGPSTLKYGIPKTAMQVACYAHSTLYDQTSGARQPIADLHTDRGLLIALDSDTGRCHIRWLNLQPAWDAVQLAGQVRAWRKIKGLDAEFTQAGPLPSLSPAEAALEQAIITAASEAALTELWSAAGASWTPKHTELAQQRLGQLTH